MATLGKFNTLRVVREQPLGVYLDAGKLGKVLLPRSYVPEHCQIEDRVEVFIYLDSQDTPTATTQKPYATVGDFALLTVVSTTPVGAFLDWGLPKDLLVPFREQKRKMEKGKSYLVHIYHDKKSDRLVASSKIDKFIGTQLAHFREGEQVALVISGRTDIGYKAIIENAHWGVLYKSEVFQELKKGQALSGFIKKMRADGKIDLCLQQAGYAKVDSIAENIIDTLKEQGSFLPLSDKSSPEMIYKLLGISKKTYKKAIGALYKQKRITLESRGIHLAAKKPPQ